MSRDPRGGAARAAEQDDDKTVVDFAAPARAGNHLASIYEDETVARPLPFDDMPTKVWTPRAAQPAAGVSKSRVTIRRLRSVPEPEPSVRIEASRPAWSDRDEVTRIELRPDIPPAEEKTAPGAAQRRAARASALSLVRLASALLLVFVAAAAAVGWHRAHPRTFASAVAAVFAPRAPVPAAPKAPLAPPVSPAPVAASAIAPAPDPVAPSEPATPHAAPSRSPSPRLTQVTRPTMSASPGAVVPGTDEYAAVEAVQSGDVRRAARLYSALAASHPTSEAYREAARNPDRRNEGVAPMKKTTFVAPLAAVPLLLIACAPPRPPAPQRFAFHVASDPGKPLAGASLVRDGKVLATSDAAGVASFALDGHDGETFTVAVECPAGFQSPAQPTQVMLRRLASPDVVAEYDAACPPRTRAIVVAVKGPRGHRLPVLRLGQEIARTDSSGVATVLVRVGPQEQFDLALDTSAHSDLSLRPESPAATFTVNNSDEVLVFDPHFTEAPKPRPPRPRRASAAPQGPPVPIRIQ